MDIKASAGKELVVPGSDPVVYDNIVIQDLRFKNEPDGRIICEAFFRYYRYLEDGSIEWAPLAYGTPDISIPDLRQVLGAIEGGPELKDAVSAAIIGIAKAQGIV